ncbi:hypothetical protein ASF72_10415 [Arthrobacter sp. Leaf141]|uniref:ATP-grasp fold amidoligase family protein n=1 Tax=Micrococcaceae TaxID=1268 RepID=UPI0006F26FFE|nr:MULTISPECIES: ATP-grasp fold amidoligase family protein [Micrococcaceae]KQR02442.1 hypothetical protein ASF72_10415 [Arthrobacter sp. Leaf141]
MASSNPYLSFMRQRFVNQQNPVDPVPWELDDKDTAYKHVSAAGYRVPKYLTVGSAAEALAAGESLGDRFVVKQPNRHSTKGVYVLETIGGGKYLELLSLRILTVDDLKTDGPEPDYWLAEECIDSGIAGKPLPMDYKIYCFRGKITHISQIDRNVSPPRLAFFDGAFLPLEFGKDYTLDESRWARESHLVPRHAGAMLKMAADLSAGLDTRFVKVDCYDGPDGPVFGEFTFASGADDIGMVRYSDEILAKLGRAIDGEEVGALSGFDIDMPGFRAALGGESTLTAHPALYSRMSAGALQADKRYSPTLAANLAAGRTRAVFALGAYVIGCLNNDESRAFAVQDLVRQGSQLIVGGGRLAEFRARALAFHDHRASGNPWHTARAAEVRLAAGTQEALEVLKALAADGYAHAERVVAKYEASFSK